MHCLENQDTTVILQHLFNVYPTQKEHKEGSAMAITSTGNRISEFSSEFLQQLQKILSIWAHLELKDKTPATQSAFFFFLMPTTVVPMVLKGVPLLGNLHSFYQTNNENYFYSNIKAYIFSLLSDHAYIFCLLVSFTKLSSLSSTVLPISICMADMIDKHLLNKWWINNMGKRLKSQNGDCCFL